MLNVNLSIHYDTVLSSLYSDYFKSEVNALFLGNRKTDYLVIFESSKIQRSSHLKKSRLEKLAKDELIYLSHSLILNGGESKADLIKNLMGVSNEQFYKDHYENNCYSDLDYDFEISGYLKVKKIGSEKFKNKMFSKKYLENIFFDCPIYGRLVISEIENIYYDDAEFLHLAKETEIFTLHLDEFLSDNYNYSKDEILNNVKEYDFYKFHNLLKFENKYHVIFKAFVYKYLKENLPEILEYR